MKLVDVEEFLLLKSLFQLIRNFDLASYFRDLDVSGIFQSQLINMQIEAVFRAE